MNKIKTVTYFIMLLFLLGCAPKITIMDEGGEKYPTPHYRLQTMDDKIFVAFYFIAYSSETDLDGQLIPIPTYIDMTKNHSFSLIDYRKIVMVLEVQNPTNERYRLWEKKSVLYNEQIDVLMTDNVAYSDRSHRIFMFPLPFEAEYKKVMYNLYMTDEKGNILLNLGNLNYTIK